jgi:hypothetical protein
MKSQHKKKKRERHEDETGEVSMTSGILGDNQILSDVSEGNPLSKNWPYYASVILFTVITICSLMLLYLFRGNFREFM